MDSYSDVLVELMSSGPKERLSIFESLSTSEQKAILLRLPSTIAEDVLSNLKDEDIERIIRVFDPDESTDILLLVEENRREKILGSIESDRRKRVNFLLGFDPETAAGLMDLG